VAAHQGRTDWLQALLSRGLTEAAAMAVHAAVRANRPEVLPALLAHARGDETSPRFLQSAVLWTALNDAGECLGLMLRAGAQLEKDRALRVAAFHGSTKVGQLLLQEGASHGAHNECGNTALHLACRAGQPGFVRLLLEAGANAAALCTHGLSPACEAARNDHLECLELLLPQLTVEQLGVRGSGPQARSPVHWAAHKSPRCLELLLRAGASPSLPSNNMLTPAMFAAHGRQPKSLRALRRAGARLCVDALCIAVRRRCKACICEFLDARRGSLKHARSRVKFNLYPGHHPGLHPQIKWTVAHVAAHQDAWETFHLLHAGGADFAEAVGSPGALARSKEAVSVLTLLGVPMEGAPDFCREAVLARAAALRRAACGARAAALAQEHLATRCRLRRDLVSACGARGLRGAAAPLEDAVTDLAFAGEPATCVPEARAALRARARAVAAEWCLGQARARLFEAGSRLSLGLGASHMLRMDSIAADWEREASEAEARAGAAAEKCDRSLLDHKEPFLS
jgi:ankyrin repeat protein